MAIFPLRIRLWVSSESIIVFSSLTRLSRYLLAMLTNSNLPEGETEFFETLKVYFPNIYDVKYLMKSCKNLKGGLQEVADMLEVERIGPQHQAGSDSLLTGRAFFKMTEIYFEDELDDSKVRPALTVVKISGELFDLLSLSVSVSRPPVRTGHQPCGQHHHSGECSQV